MWRKRPAIPPEPDREPHPDPRVEAQLQAILSVKRITAGKHDQVNQLTAKLNKVRGEIARNPGSDYTPQRRDTAEDFETSIRTLEGEIISLHAEIAKMMEGLSDVDLSYL